MVNMLNLGQFLEKSIFCQKLPIISVNLRIPLHICQLFYCDYLPRAQQISFLFQIDFKSNAHFLSQCFVLFCFVSFRFVSFRFVLVWFGFFWSGLFLFCFQRKMTYSKDRFLKKMLLKRANTRRLIYKAQIFFFSFN